MTTLNDLPLNVLTDCLANLSITDYKALALVNKDLKKKISDMGLFYLRANGIILSQNEIPSGYNWLAFPNKYEPAQYLLADTHLGLNSKEQLTRKIITFIFQNAHTKLPLYFCPFGKNGEIQEIGQKPDLVRMIDSVYNSPAVKPQSVDGFVMKRGALDSIKNFAGHLQQHLPNCSNVRIQAFVNSQFLNANIFDTASLENYHLTMEQLVWDENTSTFSVELVENALKRDSETKKPHGKRQRIC